LRVTLFERLDTGRAVGVTLHIRGPQVAGLVDVTVGGDQPVTGTLSLGHARRSYSARSRRSSPAVSWAAPVAEGQGTSMDDSYFGPAFVDVDE
jgi:hypothetical protein